MYSSVLYNESEWGLKNESWKNWSLFTFIVWKRTPKHLLSGLQNKENQTNLQRHEGSALSF